MDSNNYFEILSLGDFAKKMGISKTLVYEWIDDGFINEGDHYLRRKRKLLFMWSKDTVTSIFKNSKKKDPVIDSAIHPTSGINKGRKATKVNLDYKCKENHGKPKGSIDKH